MNDQLMIALVQSSKNLANILTKPLAAPMLSYLCQLFGLMVLEEQNGSRGGVEDYDPVTTLRGDAKSMGSEIGDN